MNLLDICSISGKKVELYNGVRNYVATGDVDHNKIINFFKYTFNEKPSRANQNVQIGEVMFAKMKDTRKVILVDEANCDNIYSTGFYILKASSAVLPKYLYYYLMSDYFNIQKDKLCVGATMKGLNNQGLKQIKINELPSLEKQSVFVKEIEALEKLIDNRKEAISIILNMINSKFYELFHNEFENNNIYKALKELTTFIDYRGKTPNKINEGVQLITAKNVKKNYFSIEPREYISKKEYDSRMTRGIPAPGDILFTTEAPLGNVCIIPNIGDIFSVGQRLITMKCNGINNYYLMYALLSDEIQNEILKKSTGSTVKGIKSKYLSEIKIPVPTLEKQTEFSNYVKTLTNLLDIVEKDIVVLNDMILMKFNTIYGEI